MKKYQIIYADPPWPVEKIKRRVRPNQRARDYPTMSVAEIARLGEHLAPLKDDNCRLFLWTTHRFLPDAFEVMRWWGFQYQRTITWDTQNRMCLLGFHHRTEFLLF